MQQLNQQAPWQLSRHPDGLLNVHSIFRTIQGEGPFGGQAALFIRLAGCNLQCPGCDTEYTSKSEPTDPEYLVKTLRTWYDWEEGLIVITGGEPFRQNIAPLCHALLQEGYTVQIETNGVLYPGDGDVFPWERVTVVCSPKTGKIHPKTAQLVTAYKYVLQYGGAMPDGLPEMALGHALGGHRHVARPPARWRGPVYVQPMDEKDDTKNLINLKYVAEQVMKHRTYNGNPLIMGIQMHKEIGLP